MTVNGLYKGGNLDYGDVIRINRFIEFIVDKIFINFVLLHFGDDHTPSPNVFQRIQGIRKAMSRG